MRLPKGSYLKLTVPPVPGSVMLVMQLRFETERRTLVRDVRYRRLLIRYNPTDQIPKLRSANPASAPPVSGPRIGIGA
jgi:hypothetical protein